MELTAPEILERKQEIVRRYSKKMADEARANFRSSYEQHTGAGAKSIKPSVKYDQFKDPWALGVTADRHVFINSTGRGDKEGQNIKAPVRRGSTTYGYRNYKRSFTGSMAIFKPLNNNFTALANELAGIQADLFLMRSSVLESLNPKDAQP